MVTKQTIGFIGLGNMGASLARAVARVGNYQLLLSQHNSAKAQQLQAEIGGELASNQDMIAQADVVFLGVKPHLVAPLLTEMQETLNNHPDVVFISMVAGVTLAQLAQYLPADKLVRIMPNTPVGIGQGMTTYCTGHADLEQVVEELLDLSGQVKKLPEHLMDAATAIAGCGPAFVYEFIEALTRAGVQNGLSVADAQFLASQTVAGTAKMVLETGQHPAVLRDAVTSPGGSTIAGLAALEQTGFAAATMAGVQAALSRTKELGN